MVTKEIPLLQLKTDEEFETNNPKLTEDEYKLLEENILTEGVIFHPLIIWNNTIIDGHNRYHILQKHPEIPFSVIEKEFEDRIQALIWICKNQLGRRNLTPEQKSFLIGKRYDMEKAATAGGSKGRPHDAQGRFTSCLQDEAMRFSEKRTSERIAKENNVSRSYVERAVKYAGGIDAAEEICPGIKTRILRSELKVPMNKIIAIGKAAPEDRLRLVEEIQKPRKKKPDILIEQEEKVEHEPTEVNQTEMPISEYRDEGTEDDMMAELKDSLWDMIWRWKNCKRCFSKVIKSEKSKNIIKGLTREGLDFLEMVDSGYLWSDDEIEK